MAACRSVAAVAQQPLPEGTGLTHRTVAKEAAVEAKHRISEAVRDREAQRIGVIPFLCENTLYCRAEWFKKLAVHSGREMGVSGRRGQGDTVARRARPVNETTKLRLWTLAKVPLLFFLRPSVVEATERRTVIRIRLTRRSRNHLGSMYFAALCAGADVAGGLTAMRRIEASGRRVSLIFKDVRAQFQKRAEGDVLFSCEDGEAIAELVRRAIASGEREELPVRIVATVPDKLGSEPVAEFVLTLSLKRLD